MPGHYDALETRDPARARREQFARCPAFVARAMTAPGWARHLAGIDPEVGQFARRAGQAAGAAQVRHRGPAKGKPAVRRAQRHAAGQGETAADVAGADLRAGRPRQGLVGNCARALFAAGFRAGDIVHNSFAYHLTPGAFILEEGAHALGCAVIPGGVGNTEQQLEAIAHYRPSGYVGTPDFLKILLDTAEKTGKDAASIKRALVSGAALPASLREELGSRGVAVLQCYAIAELGVIAYESDAREGMIVNESVIVEIVRPGTGDPVAEGDVGEVVVTSFNPDYPMIRLGTGDLSALMPGVSPCGRTNARIKGWMGRADQTAKVKGMFVHPKQIAEVAARHPQLARLRLVVGREGEQDTMTLMAECAAPDAALAAAVAATLQSVTKLKGAVKLVAPGTLPNDGKVIADERKP